eukprot:c11242_g1_i2.p1 GENE.c11242_g1_i2~~c11242_g1_i2.p1  ORF type:complete len:404 (-),score=88.94 c11242_g1_i2:1110-2297(-)
MDEGANSRSSSVDFIEVSRQELDMIQSDDDAEHPAVEYKWVEGGIAAIKSQATLTALAVTARFLAVGTSQGTIHILDFCGNEIKRYQKHISNVLDIGFDESLDFMASAGQDGTACVTSLYADGTNEVAPLLFTSTNAELQTLFTSSVNSVCVDPKYSSGFNRHLCVACQSGELLVNTPGWIKGRRNNTLDSSASPVFAVRWSGAYVAWATDSCVKVLNYSSGQRLGLVRHNHQHQHSDTPVDCRLIWDKNKTLVIAWDNRVKVVQIQNKDPNDPGSGEELMLLHSFTTTFLICGICVHDQFLILLALPELPTAGDASIGARASQRQFEIHIVTRNCDELLSEAIDVFAYPPVSPAEFDLQVLKKQNQKIFRKKLKRSHWKDNSTNTQHSTTTKKN